MSFARAALALVLLAVPALADVLVLKDGRRLEGNVVAETEAEVTFRTPFGTFTFAREEIAEIERGKTRREEFRERLEACETADEFHALGLWAEDQKLRKEAKQAYARAIEVDPDHEGARTELGYVRYRGEWMTPEERDARREAELEAEMRAEGLVPHEGRWVTPEDKEKLEQGLVLVDGDWVDPDEAKRRGGLELFEGRWLPRPEALARSSAAELDAAVGGGVEYALGAEALVAGTLPRATLQEIAEGLERGREWFDEAWQVEPGLGIHGDRLAEFLVFDDDEEAYRAAVDWVAERSNYVPDGWAEAVKRTHGFVWIDPVSTSVVRRWKRGPRDVVGHCYHHLGHVLVGRHGYEDRLLPAWYEEGVAALCELRISGGNAVFCRTNVSATGGTTSGEARAEMGADRLRDGSWRIVLKDAIRRGEALPFDRLAQRDFGQLELMDIAQSIAIVEWIESAGDGALARFHRELRAGAPEAPQRVILFGGERRRVHDAAFGAAVGMPAARADQEWRQWFLSR